MLWTGDLLADDLLLDWVLIFGWTLLICWEEVLDQLGQGFKAVRDLVHAGPKHLRFVKELSPQLVEFSSK